VVFNTGPYTVLSDNPILITTNMQSETGFPSSHQLKSYVASKSSPTLAARAVLSAEAGLLVISFVIRQRAPAVHTFTVKRLDCARQCCRFRYFHNYGVGQRKACYPWLPCYQMGQQLVFIFFVLQSVKGRIDESGEL